MAGPVGPDRSSVTWTAQTSDRDQLLAMLERERAQAAAVERERRRLDLILNQMPAMVVVFDAEGRIVQANDQYLSVTGFTADQILGRSYTDFPYTAVDAAGQPLPFASLPSARALRGEVVDTEFGLIVAGRTRWVQVSAVPMRDDGGQIEGVILTMRDLTAEREAAEALRASEARQHALLDAMPDSLYVLDANETVVERRAPDDGRVRLHDVYLGRTLSQLLGPELGALLHEQVVEARATGRTTVLEYQFASEHGTLDREARIVAMGQDRTLLLVRDIGDRKQAEREREALLRTVDWERRRLDAILHQLPHSLIVFDTEARIVLANEGLSATLGIPMDEIVGRRTTELGSQFMTVDGVPISEDDLPSRRALRGHHYDGEVLAKRSSGQHAWLHVSAAPVRDESGAIVGAILATRNITAERETRETLRANEIRTRALLDAIPDSLYVNDRDGLILDHKAPRDGRPMLLQAPFVGQRVYEVWPSAISTMILDMTSRTLDSGRMQTIEYQIPTPNGPAFREARCVPYGENVVLALVRDVDARKRAELALHELNQQLEDRIKARTAELEDANAQLEAFSYSVSHDLKAPLRGVDGYSRLLWEDYGNRLDDDGKFLLQSVRQAAAQMHQLIDDLLAYSRLERRALADAAVEIRPIVEGLLAERADEIAARPVQLAVTVPDATIHADREGFAQAFRNLLDNALRFTAGVAAPQIEIVGTVQPTTYTLAVRDNGIGFDMAYHDRIFEIFQRLHRQEEYPGTGIGLALVRKAMQRMGGRVWAESSPGTGAAFFLELPR